jgi:hypothetical protein
LHHHDALCIAAFGFLFAERAVSPPQDAEIREDPGWVTFPPVVARQMPPLRPERHVPSSVAMLRRRLIVALVAHPPRCPYCGTARTTELVTK